MNKLLTEINGKFPFVLDDLRFLDASYRQTFKAILDGLGMGNENFYISGGFVDGNIIAGAVYINGEICVIDDQFIDDMDDTKYIDYDISYDAAGLKTFGDAQSHNTYEIRKAKIYNSATPPTGYIPVSIPNMSDVITNIQGKLYDSGWVDCVPIIEMTAFNVKARIKNGFVIIDGNFTTNGYAVLGIFQLPLAIPHPPDRIINYLLITADNTSREMVTIDTSGLVEFVDENVHNLPFYIRVIYPIQ